MDHATLIFITVRVEGDSNIDRLNNAHPAIDGPLTDAGHNLVGKIVGYQDEVPRRYVLVINCNNSNNNGMYQTYNLLNNQTTLVNFAQLSAGSSIPARQYIDPCKASYLGTRAIIGELQAITPNTSVEDVFEPFQCFLVRNLGNALYEALFYKGNLSDEVVQSLMGRSNVIKAATLQ